jgi:hypothetical protein
MGIRIQASRQRPEFLLCSDVKIFLGAHTLMAATLVFNSGMLRKLCGIRSVSPNTGADSRSAWGYWEMWDYPSKNKERVRMRRLKIAGKTTI